MTQRRVPGVEPGLTNDDRHVNVTVENTGEGTVYRAEPRYVTHTTADTHVVERAHHGSPRRDNIRWGPIVAGLIATIAAMLVLSVLGLALGLSIFEPTSDGSDVGTAASIWSAVSALASFLFGGWFAGRTASVHGDDNALLNGFMVGASALALVLWLASMGVGNLLGGIGSNIDEIARVGRDTAGTVNPNAAAQDARNAAINAYDEARNGAWGTLAGMLLALGASTVGALIGHKTRHDHTGYEYEDGFERA